MYVLRSGHHLHWSHHAHVLFTCEDQLEVNYPSRGIFILVMVMVTVKRI